MSEDTFVKDPAVVDALFIGLSDLQVHPDRLHFVPVAPTSLSMRGGSGDVRQAFLRPSSESFQPDGTRSCKEDIQVAVKKLRDLERVDLPRRKRMVVREIQLLSKVVHPNIVPFRGFHVDFEGSVAWLISDWEPLGNVSDYLCNHNVSLNERLRLLLDTITALDYIHSLDPPICHGDIKAANVLVNRDRRAMLCDFGLARIIEDEGFKSLETSVDVQGSIPWCSPEVLNGKRASPESDVWAFGCLVWEVLTGTAPFADLRNNLAIIAAIVQRRLPQPQQTPIFQKFPLLGKLVKDCWHKDPVARPSAKAGSSVLAKILEATNIQGDDDVGNAQSSWFTWALLLVLSCGGARAPHKINLWSEVATTKVPPSAPVPSKPLEHPTVPPEAATLDSGISRLSPEAVGDYIVNPVGSRLTWGGEIADILERFDFTGRLVDVQAATSGGLSDVKIGRIYGSNTVVAIKVLRFQNMSAITHDLSDPQLIRLRKRMARERRIWFFLRHPRILESLGFAFLSDQPCLLSPWCKNGNAKEYVAKNPSTNRMDLVVQVAEGLIYLHSRNPMVIYADLKPINILINDGGDALICDFGTSKVSGEANTGLTTSQDAFMSLRYAAPEILQNEKPTWKSDVYGFGCVALGMP